MKIVKTQVLSWIAVLMTCAAVYAAPRSIKRHAALREGPGSFYPVVSWLERGTTVDAVAVRGSWIESRTLQKKQGWLPRNAFKAPRKGVDYAGLLNSDKAVVISSVDIAAATKGAFEARYSEKKKVDFKLMNELDSLKVNAAEVSRILGYLKPAVRPVVPNLPHPVYKNNVIVNGDAEHLLGRAIAATLVTPGFIDNSNTIARVNEIAAVVGMRTQRYDLPLRVAVIDDESVAGYGLPGGYIVISSGMLKEVRSEAELACLLGHEMAHVCLYHGLREFNKRSTHRKSDSAFAELDAQAAVEDPFAELNQLSGDTNAAAIEKDLRRLADTSYMKVIGKRGRQDELEADLYGAAYAADAGYNPEALVNYLERIKNSHDIHDAFRNHPSLDDRISALQSGISRYRIKRAGQTDKPECF